MKPRHLTLGVSLPHLAILRWLDRMGPISISAAAKFADVSPSAMTQAAQKLEQLGLVTRRRDAHDQRIVWLALTEQGSEQVHAVKRLRRQRLHALLTTLDSDDRRQLARILSAMAEAADRLPGT